MTSIAANLPPHPPTSINWNDQVLAPYVSPTKDFTVYWPKRQRADWDDRYFSTLACEETIRVLGQFEKSAEGTDGRACVCSCFNRQFLSGTFRCKDRPKSDRTLHVPSWSCSPNQNKTGEAPEVFVETKVLVDALLHSLGFPPPPLEITPPFRELPQPIGLVVFAGSTNSAKSTVAQAFALEVIRRKLCAIQIEGRRAEYGDRDTACISRLPHLVTYENPIEGWFIGSEALCPKTAIQYDFCLTAREAGKDVANLRQALSQARRQTPTCFYIGEIRDREEWNDTLDFAGTGHLVVVTTHASSLTEALARILRFSQARSPSHRRDVGSQLLGCFHLRSTTLPSGAKFILPTFWANKSAALNSLVADGLSSLSPNGDFVLSRYQFLKDQLIAHNRIDPIQAESTSDAIAAARKFDIEELHRQ